jgi:uncharacterized membrane protein
MFFLLSTTDQRRTTTAHGFARPSTVVRLSSYVLRLTSNVFRLTFLPVLPVSIPLVSLCLGGECFSFFDQRRTTTAHEVARPSTVVRLSSYVLRLTSNVFRLTFLPVLPVILPLVSWRLGGENVLYSGVETELTHSGWEC